MSAVTADNIPVLMGDCIDSDGKTKLPTIVIVKQTTTTSKVANVQFDSDGDVVLLLKNDKGTARFQVNSSILCMSSSVFRAMLGARSHFKEAKELASRDHSMAPLEVSIEGDDPDVFAVILRVLHHQHDSVPKEIKVDKLFQVAILCDKYDLRQSLSFWLERWIPTPHELRSVILPGNVASQDDKRLFMAYVFRKEEAFTAISKDLILMYKDNGPLGGTTQFENIPQKIVDAIMGARMAAIEAMIGCVRQCIASYDDPMKVQCQYKRECCDAFVLGLLIREFKKVGLYPEAPSIHKQSVKEIGDKVASVKRPKFALFDDPKVPVDGCCSTPVLCTCGRSWCYNCSSKRCMICHRDYKPPVALEVNHASCAPIGSVAAAVTDITTKIVGLEYSRFVGKNKDEGYNGSNVEANADLWDCLKYI